MAKINQELENNIIKDYQDGLSMDKIAAKYSINRKTVAAALKRNNIQARTNKINSRKYIHDFDYFEIIDTEEKAYWLGFIYADGYISIHKNKGYTEYKLGIAISTEDINHLEKFKQCINASNPISIYTTSGYSTSEYCRILLTSEKTVKDLINKGVLEHKSNILKFPTKEQVPDHLLHHFIRGYFDGDGCITSYTCSGYERYKTSFIGTFDFLNSINNIIDTKYSIKIPQLFKRKESQEVYSLEYSSNKRSKILYNFMYENATIYLERKYNKYSRLMKK